MSQPPRILTTNGLEVPPDFPFEPYEAIHSGSRPRSKEAADVALRTEFGSAWSAVGNRFVAAAYYSDSFKQSADKDGIATTPTVRYEEERALFGFFANAISSIDAAYNGLYVIGAFSSPRHFSLVPAEPQYRANRAATYRAYVEAFPDDPIVSELDAVQTDTAFHRLRDTRNILSHRAVLPRQYRLGMGKQPTKWLSGIDLTPDLLTPYRADLARLLTQVLEATAAFVSRHPDAFTPP